MPDVGCRAGTAALVHHVPGTPFTLPALRCHAKFKLNLVKAHASAGVAGNVTVRDAAADANNHGNTIMDKRSVGAMHRSCRTVAAEKNSPYVNTELIINTNPSH